MLQQPGPADDSVIVATPGALLEVPLGGGDPVAYLSGGSGAPAAPVRVAGCAHGAWAAAQASYLQVCAGRTKAVALDSMTSGAQLSFRVNRDAVVLNDVSGNVWAPATDPALRSPNWADVFAEEQLDNGDTSSDQRSTQTLQAECTPQSAPPHAADDTTGSARAGHDLVGDRQRRGVRLRDAGDPDLDPLPAAFGSIVPIYGGRAIQLVTAPGGERDRELHVHGQRRPRVERALHRHLRLTVRPGGDNGAARADARR